MGNLVAGSTIPTRLPLQFPVSISPGQKTMKSRHRVRCSTVTSFLLAVACALSFSTFTFAQGEQETIKVDTELVNLNVVVMDRQGRRIGGLKKEDFEVYEDGAQQQISHFAAEERPLRLVLLFDTSVSMEEVLPAVKQEAIRLINNLQVDDRVSILSFASQVRLISSWVDRDQAVDEVRKITSEAHPSPLPATIWRRGYNIGDGNTYLYEAFKYVFDHFRADSDRIAVLMFSDGVDSGAGRDIGRIKKRSNEIGKQVKRQAEESWALVYPIRYKTRQFIGALPEPAHRPIGAIRLGRGPADPGRELFSKIASASGGEVFEWTTQQDLTVVIENALADLRSQYGLAYKPPRTDDSSGSHRIKVRVKRPEMIVRTRESYRRAK